MDEATSKKLLDLMGKTGYPTADEFKQLIEQLDTHRVLAKVFILDGTPFVFKDSPMKYIVFKELVADRFEVGSQDICIVGSAKLGFSPSPHTYGKTFSETSDVDVVVISEPLFLEGSHEQFNVLNLTKPSVFEIRKHLEEDLPLSPPIDPRDWKTTKEAIRNFVFENFNPGLLPKSNHLRVQIFDSISSTSGLFLALEPKVFVSKIRSRIFRTWKAAEDYYSNSLRETKRSFIGAGIEIEIFDEESEEDKIGG